MSKIDLNPDQDYPDASEFGNEMVRLVVSAALIALAVIALGSYALLQLYDFIKQL